MHGQFDIFDENGEYIYGNIKNLENFLGYIGGLDSRYAAFSKNYIFATAGRHSDTEYDNVIFSIYDYNVNTLNSPSSYLTQYDISHVAPMDDDKFIIVDGLNGNNNIREIKIIDKSIYYNVVKFTVPSLIPNGKDSLVSVLYTTNDRLIISKYSTSENNLYIYQYVYSTGNMYKSFSLSFSSFIDPLYTVYICRLYQLGDIMYINIGSYNGINYSGFKFSIKTTYPYLITLINTNGGYEYEDSIQGKYDNNNLYFI